LNFFILIMSKKHFRCFQYEKSCSLYARLAKEKGYGQFLWLLK